MNKHYFKFRAFNFEISHFILVRTKSIHLKTITSKCNEQYP